MESTPGNGPVVADPHFELVNPVQVMAAKVAIAEEKRQRAVAYNKESLALQKKYNCTLAATPFIDDEGRVRARVEIIPLETKE